MKALAVDQLGTDGQLRLVQWDPFQVWIRVSPPEKWQK